MLKLKNIFKLIKNNQWDLLIFKIGKRLGFKNLVAPLPETLTIEPTNVCTMKCPTCPTGAGKMNRPKMMMKLEDYKKIIDQLKGYTTKVVLFNYGEPFLHKDILEMIRCAVEVGMFVKTSTNGEFFKSPEYCREIVKTGLQHLIICLDGADNETVNRFRGNTDFEKLIQSFKEMIKAKKELNSKYPIIELQFILMKHNEHQREKMKSIARELGVDVYLEKTAGVDINEPEFQKMAEELLPTNSDLTRFEKDESGRYRLKGKIPNYCSQVLTSVVVNSDGSVVPCCYDLYSHHIMGNAYEKSLRKIWWGKKYRDFRKQIKKNRRAILMCNICSEGRYEVCYEKEILK